MDAKVFEYQHTALIVRPGIDTERKINIVFCDDADKPFFPYFYMTADHSLGSIRRVIVVVRLQDEKIAQKLLRLVGIEVMNDAAIEGGC